MIALSYVRIQQVACQSIGIWLTKCVAWIIRTVVKKTHRLLHPMIYTSQLLLSHLNVQSLERPLSQKAMPLDTRHLKSSSFLSLKMFLWKQITYNFTVSVERHGALLINQRLSSLMIMTAQQPAWRIWETSSPVYSRRPHQQQLARINSAPCSPQHHSHTSFLFLLIKRPT